MEIITTNLRQLKNVKIVTEHANNAQVRVTQNARNVQLEITSISQQTRAIYSALVYISKTPPIIFAPVVQILA